MLDIWPQDSYSPRHLFLTESPNSECFNSSKRVWLVRPRPFLEFVLDLCIFSMFWHHSITCLTVSTLTYADTVTSAPLLTALLVTCGCSLEDCCHLSRSICFYAWISNDQASGRGHENPQKPVANHEESLKCGHFVEFVGCSCPSLISPLKRM